MVPDSIITAMSRQAGAVKRTHDELPKVHSSLEALELSRDQQVKEFFEEFKLSAVLTRRGQELLDLCSPAPQIEEATEFGRDTFDIPENFVCLTSGEGEEFILYSKRDGKVYDVSVSQLYDLEAGKTEATWSSFYNLIEWYLSADS
jgi:hypothetical protein